MCNPIVIPIIALAAQAVSTLTGAKSQYDAAKYNAKIAEANAEQQEILANDQINSGNAEAQRVRTEAQRTQASQVAALASNGLDLSSGSALNLLSDTSAQGELDAQLTLNNSLREAYGLRQQAENYRADAKMLRKTGKQQYYSTLLTGLAQTYGSYQMMNSNGAFSSSNTGTTSRSTSNALQSSAMRRSR